VPEDVFLVSATLPFLGAQVELRAAALASFLPASGIAAAATRRQEDGHKRDHGEREREPHAVEDSN
jgi:hypothetical protein